MLAEREATGERLSQAERRWAEEHRAECANCAGESRLWRALSEVIAEPEPSVPRPADSSGVRSAFGRIRLPPRLRRCGGWLFAAAAGIVLTVSMVRWLRHWQRARPTAAQLTPSLRVVTVAGEVTMGSRSVRAGEAFAVGERLHTEHGQICLSIDASVTACLDTDSEASLFALDRAMLGIRLEHGGLASRLEQQPPQRRYVVQTSKASITAEGTEFVVRVDAEQRVVVHLHQGQLSIKGPDDHSSGIVGPAAAVINDKMTVEAWSPRIIEAEKNLVQLARLPRTDRPIELDVTTRPMGATVTLDDLVLGPTPLSASIHGGHRLILSMPGFATVTEILPTDLGERLQRNYELTELPATIAPNEAEPAAETSPTPKGLLARAEVLRAEGKYRDCAAVYRQLVTRFSTSDEARVAWVSLGDLELSELGQPAQAELAFETYLRQPGPLTREARYGRIRALQMLSRKAEVQMAIAAFLKDYPKSVQAERLRRRRSVR
jgi:ferric-dicitrate binding protein FerR (iron transport regulator)